MTWGSTWDEVLRAVLVLWVPGSLVGLAIGLRRWWLVAVAPALSVGTLAVWAVLLSAAGVPWTAVSAGAASLLTAGALLGSQTLLRRVWRPDVAPLGWWPATVVGVGVAALLAARSMRDGIVQPDAPPQTWDAIFHLNAVQRILETQDASSLHLGRLSSPSSDVAIYPAAWHGVVSLVVTDDVVVATNVLAVLVAAVIFPVGCALLGAALLPGSRLLPGLTAVASVAFVAFPSRMLSYGTLWPNALAYALLPAALALTVRILVRSGRTTMYSGRPVTARHFAPVAARGPSAGDQRRDVGRSTSRGDRALILPLMETEASRPPLVLALLLSLAAITAAHPNALLGYVAVAGVLVVLRALQVAAEALDTGRHLRVAGVLAGTTAAVSVTMMLFLTPQMQSAIAYDRPTYATGLDAVWQALGDSQLVVTGAGNAHPSWALGGLTVLGFVIAVVRSRLRWLAIAYLVVLVLFVAANDPTLPFGFLAGPWYSDAVRLGGLVVVVAVPLVGLALEAMTALVLAAASAVPVLLPSLARPGRPAVLRGAVVSVAGAGVLVVFLATTDLARDGLRTQRVLAEYGRSDDPAWPGILTTGEIELVERLAEELPDDAVVLGNPFTGAALVYALGGTDVVFPHLRGDWSPEARYLGLHLADLETDPRVCAAIEDLGVTHLYVDPQLYWPTHPSQLLYAGMAGEPPAVDGFVLVDEAERARVYAVDAC